MVAVCLALFESKDVALSVVAEDIVVLSVILSLFIDSLFAVFGKVVEGMDVVDAIKGVPTGAQDKPNEDVIINEVVVLTK